uniref:DNA-dependent metalloprotease SPRTN n=1 Tax=Callorhinchus milii TaxID=7868 RepID=A0A4W3GTJ7_CALMI
MDGVDYLLALQLQEELQREEAAASGASASPAAAGSAALFCNGRQGGVEEWARRAPQKPLSVVDESWELIDPSPDLRALFLQFDDMFFWGAGQCTAFQFSVNVPLCAGVCCYEGRGGLCSIRISEPLLKLRPRRDLVETLLHEMIHALLFVTNNNKDHDSHGPEFCKHMKRINGMTGANVTIYHTFHDEVDEYRRHWWRCDGPCQKRAPYFGYVKRAMNRAPSANDPWWADHQETCGGTYIKIKEPENYKKPKKGKAEQTPINQPKPVKHKDQSPGVDIRSLFPFNGKGYALGGNRDDLLSGNTTIGRIPQNSKLLSPFFQNGYQHPEHSSMSDIKSDQCNMHKPVSLPPVRPVNSATSGVSHSANGLSSSLSGWLLKHSSSNLKSSPKKSVSNRNAFVNINGSPVKIPISTKAVKEDICKSGQKRVHSEMFNSSQQYSSSSRQSDTNRDDIKAKKKVRTATDLSRSSILHAFPKLSEFKQVEQMDKISSPQSSSFSQQSLSSSDNTTTNEKLRTVTNVSRNSVLPVFPKSLEPKRVDQLIRAHEFSQSKSQHRDIGESANPRTSQVDTMTETPNPDHGSITVNCPVCCTVILESKINEHLDSCLK